MDVAASVVVGKYAHYGAWFVELAAGEGLFSGYRFSHLRLTFPSLACALYVV